MGLGSTHGRDDGRDSNPLLAKSSSDQVRTGRLLTNPLIAELLEFKSNNGVDHYKPAAEFFRDAEQIISDPEKKGGHRKVYNVPNRSDLESCLRVFGTGKAVVLDLAELRHFSKEDLGMIIAVAERGKALGGCFLALCSTEESIRTKIASTKFSTYGRSIGCEVAICSSVENGSEQAREYIERTAAPE